MKKITGIIFILLTIASFSFAQGNKDEIRQKIRAKKVAFITDKLALTPEEAQAFWPLYNAHYKQARTIRKSDKRRNMDLEQLSDAEVAKIIDQHLDQEAALLAAKRDFIQQAKEVLPIKKVAKLARAERKFKEWMLENSRGQKRKNRSQNH